MKRNLLYAALSLAVLPCLSKAQTTQLQQTGPDSCVVTGCVNAPLSDKEVFSWSNTPSGKRLAFRGLNYWMTGSQVGSPTQDLTTVENNGFIVHEIFTIPCFRCGYKWHNGYLQANNEYIGSDPGLYGWDGRINVTSGNGQVGLVTATPFTEQTVTLVSSDPTQIQVPSSVTILAGSLDANFTIVAIAPEQHTSPPYLTESFITITATFPDGTSSTATVGVQPLPAPTPPDSKLEYNCGSKKIRCPGFGR